MARRATDAGSAVTLMGTAQGAALLSDVAQRSPSDTRVRGRLQSVQALFADELGYIEAELAASAVDGAAPGTSAARHLVDAGGKRVRPLTVLLAASCFGARPAAARELAIVAELVHNATLLHDDVIDDSDERRGRPTSRRVWSNAVSVLAGDLLLTHALDRTFAAAPAALPSLLATLRRLVDGRSPLRGRTELDTSEQAYFRVLHDKTASLFAWSARAGGVVAGATAEQADALAAFGAHLGTAFQLVDDALDYAGDPATTGKALYGDLVEGKLTLPLVWALGRSPDLAPELGLVRAGDLAAATRLGAAVRALGVCDDVRRRAAVETETAVASLDALPPSPARELLAGVALELTARAR